MEIKIGLRNISLEKMAGIFAKYWICILLFMQIVQ